MPVYTLRRLPRSLLLKSAFTPSGLVSPRVNGGARLLDRQTDRQENRLWGASVYCGGNGKPDNTCKGELYNLIREGRGVPSVPLVLVGIAVDGLEEGL